MKKEIKKEAMERLNILKNMGMESLVRSEFWHGTTCFTKPVIMGSDLVGVNTSFSNNPEFDSIRKRFEEKYDCTVYYAIYTETDFGNLLSLLFLQNSGKCWKKDKADLLKLKANSYVYNLSIEEGEFGPIGMAMANGGCIRFW